MLKTIEDGHIFSSGYEEKERAANAVNTTKRNPSKNQLFLSTAFWDPSFFLFLHALDGPAEILRVWYRSQEVKTMAANPDLAAAGLSESYSEIKE